VKAKSAVLKVYDFCGLEYILIYYVVYVATSFEGPQTEW